MSFNSTLYPTARKAHRCDECGRAISAGERYSRTFGTWEGDTFSNKACLHCAIARVIVDNADDWYWEGFYGGLSTWFDEPEGAGVWGMRLCVGFRRCWQRFDGTGLMPLPRSPWPGFGGSTHLDASLSAIVGSSS